jgi:histidine triad (HIT) family protein
VLTVVKLTQLDPISIRRKRSTKADGRIFYNQQPEHGAFMSFDPDCIFCQIIDGQAPADVVYRDDMLIAFMDIHPVTPGHLLVVPKYHSSDLTGLPEEYASRLLMVAGKLSATLRRSELRCEGINLFMAMGEIAGQTVFHTHLHIIPRFKGDGFGIRLLGKALRRSPTPLSEQAAMIRSALEQQDD